MKLSDSIDGDASLVDWLGLTIRWRSVLELLDRCVAKSSVMKGQWRVDPFAALLKYSSIQTRARQYRKQGQARVEAGSRESMSGHRQGSGQGGRQTQIRVQAGIKNRLLSILG